MKARVFAVIMGLLFLISCGEKSASDVVADIVISDEQEILMGAQYAAYIDSSPEYPLLPPDHKLSKYIDSLGQLIVKKNTGKPGFRDPDPSIGFSYKFHVINSNVINAFAVPGGWIYVYKGLIDSVHNEAELVGVISHEIGHVVKKHSKKQIVENFATDAILSMIFGDRSLIGSAISVLAATSRSREDEFEADSCGVIFTYNSGYNPMAIANFFEVLKRLGDMGSLGKILVWVQTHPLTSDRIEYVKKLINKYCPNYQSLKYEEDNFLKHVK